MVNMAANEARDVQAQYGRDDIIDDVAVTLRNHTEDMTNNNLNNTTIDNTVNLTQTLNNQAVDTDNNLLYTESTFITAPSLQASVENNRPRPSNQYDAQYLAQRVLAAATQLVGGATSGRTERDQSPPAGHGYVEAGTYLDYSDGRAPNAGTLQSHHGSTRVSSGNSQSMGYLPRRQYAPRHTIEGYAYLPTSAGYQDLGTGIQPVDRPVLHHARPSGRTPYSHASGLGVRRPIPATVGLDINVGFPATPGYAGPVGDITVGDLAIDPNLEGATGYAEINTNGEEYPGALFDKLLEENDAGVYDNMLENDAGAVAVAVDAGAGVYDNMLGNDAGAVDAGAGADTGGAPHSNVQDDMPAPRSRGRPRGSKRKAPSDEQKNNKPATRVRITPPAPPVTLPDGKPSLTASLGDPAVPSTHQRKLPSLVDAADPFCCHLCYHCFIQKSTLRDHYYDTHKEQLGLTRKSLNDYHYAKRENMKTLSWYNAQGLDTTYRGTDRKQINARRRMVAGLKTTDPNYLRDVYKDTTAEKYKLKKT